MMRFGLRCAVFFAVTFPVLAARHFHLAFWQYFVLALLASLVAEGVWRLVARRRRLAIAVIALAVLVGAAGIVMFFVANQPNVVYLVEVDDVVARPDDFARGRVRVHGYASPGTLVRAGGALELVVAGSHAGPGLKIRYAGPVPDQLRDGMEIVAAGHLLPPDRLDADELLVKCPSNYDRNAGARPF